MPTIPFRLARAAALAAVLAAGSATASTLPHPSEAAIDACSRLAAEIGAAEDARRAALAEQHDAWKAIVPFAVLARYAGGASTLAEIDGRLASLHHESAHRRCNAADASARPAPRG